MARLFGTDGVRGVVNDFLTPELAYHMGRAAATYFGRQKDHPSFLIGRDTRISGGMLEASLASGICAAGGNVILAGVIPTPGVAYLVRHFGVDAGVVISASHNPYPDNGIKFFDGQGFKLPDAVEDEIEGYVRRLREEYGAISTFLTGGNRSDFPVSAESCTFADEYLVARGLATDF